VTKGQLDLAYRTASELSMYAQAIDQHGDGNARIASAMRNAASLLMKMVEEAEQSEGAE
jgi:hypothetical protein